jgi:hypothetical protein
MFQLYLQLLTKNFIKQDEEDNSDIDGSDEEDVPVKNTQIGEPRITVQDLDTLVGDYANGGDVALAPWNIGYYAGHAIFDYYNQKPQVINSRSNRYNSK